MGSAWWATKLRDTAPHIQTAHSDTARTILSTIFLSSKPWAHHNLNKTAVLFWNFKPDSNMALYTCLNDIHRRYQVLRENMLVSSDMKTQISHPLLFHYDQFISECQCSVFNSISNKISEKNDATYSYCYLGGHLLDDSRKKRRAEKRATQNN